MRYCIFSYDEMANSLNMFKDSPDQIDLAFQYLVEEFPNVFSEVDALCFLHLNERINYFDFQNEYMRYFDLAHKIISEYPNLHDKLLWIAPHSALDGNYNVNGNYVNMPMPKPSFVHTLMVDPFRIFTYFQNNYNEDYKGEPVSVQSDSGKYLCKFGKLGKVPGYLLFCNMLDLDLFHERLGEWSLSSEQLPKTVFDMIDNRSLPTLDPETIRQHHRILNDLPEGDWRIKDLEGYDFHYTGFPFDVQYYRDTSFSIVRETIAVPKMSMFISEKTWIPISVKHPVLLISTASQADYMKASGYLAPDNFQNCYQNPDGSDSSYDHKLNLFKDSYHKFVNTPASVHREMAEVNYNLYLKGVLQDIDNLPKGNNHIQIQYGKKPQQRCIINSMLQLHYRNDHTPNKNFKFDEIEQAYS